VLVVALECRYRHGLQRCDSLGTCRHVTQYVTKWVRGPVERLPICRSRKGDGPHTCQRGPSLPDALGDVEDELTLSDVAFNEAM
jgi:hypothetical protein